MNKFQKINLSSYLVLFLAILIAFSFKGQLPEIIPTKFDEAGNVLKQAPLIPSLFFLPIIGFISLFVLTFLVKKNTAFWTKDENKLGVALTNLGIAFLIASLYLGTFLTALNFESFFKYSYFAIGFGLFFAVSAKGMVYMERNFLYGIRTPWSLASDENWKGTHLLASKLMLVFGVFLFVAGFLTKNHTLILSLVAVPLLVPFIYSYQLSKKS